MAGIQLKASSIVEVVIAMVVIVTVFTIAMMICANVQRLSLSVQKIKAQGMLNETLLAAEKIPALTKQTLTVDGIRIEEEISSYANSGTLHLIDLTAYDQNQEKIAEVKEVVNDDK